MCDIKLLRTIPLFNSLSAHDLSYLCRHMTKTTAQKGELLCRENASSTHLFIVREGVAHLYKGARRSQNSLVNTVTTGHMFGEESFLSGSPYTYSAEAGTHMKILKIKNDALRTLVKRSPDITLQLSLGLCQKLHQAHTKLAKERGKNMTIVIHNNGDPRAKAWFALELAMSMQEQFRKKVLLLDLASQSPTLQDIINLKRPYHYLVINLPPTKDALSETVLKYSDHILNLGHTPLPYTNTMDLSMPTGDHKRAWYVGHIARRIAKRTVGLALGSGTTGGLTHIGVFKALETLNIPVDMIAGTSGGALYGSMFAAGRTADEIRDFIVKKANASLFSTIRPTFSLSGFFSTHTLIAALRLFLNKKQFQELHIPLKVVATDLTSHKKIVFSKGNFLKAIKCSISIPLVFKSERFANKVISDGAAVDPLPVDILKEAGLDTIIASYPTQRKKTRENPKHAMEIYMKTRTISNDVLALKSGEDADVFFNPDTSKYGSFEYKKAADIIAFGTKEALHCLKQAMHSGKLPTF